MTTGFEPDTVLRGDAVEVWTMPAAMTAVSAEALALVLDAGERARAERFRRPGDRAAFIAARALARVMLSAFGPLAPSDWRIVTSCFGKPILHEASPGRDLRFSLSHADGLAVCALAAGHDVGVDVEDRDAAKLLPTSRGGLWLTAQERIALSAQEQSARGEQALRLWLLKEAFAKAIGLGLHLPFDQIGFALDPLRASLPTGLGPARWQFEELHPTAHHRLALAVRLSRRSPIIVRSRKIDTNAFASATRLSSDLVGIETPRGNRHRSPCPKPCASSLSDQN